MPEYAEQEILEGCCRNDRVYQEYLYRKNYSLFLKVCARYARNMEDAEQLVNDGFLKIFNKIKSFGGKGSFEGWMRRIMINNCLDYLKSKYLKDTANTLLTGTLSEDVFYSEAANALSKMVLKDLLTIIQTLPPMSRAVFNLFVFDGYPHKEIAKILAISEGTSQWHVNNARKTLQQKLKDEQIKNELRYEQK
jgi:RNA polymerase sigma-70 factor (ECF subfamily)